MAVGWLADFSSCRFTQFQVQVHQKKIDLLCPVVEQKAFWMAWLAWFEGKPCARCLLQRLKALPCGRISPRPHGLWMLEGSPPDKYRCWMKGKWILRKSNTYLLNCASVYLSESWFLFSLLPKRMEAELNYIQANRLSIWLLVYVRKALAVTLNIVNIRTYEITMRSRSNWYGCCTFQWHWGEKKADILIKNQLQTLNLLQRGGLDLFCIYVWILEDILF